MCTGWHIYVEALAWIVAVGQIAHHPRARRQRHLRRLGSLTACREPLAQIAGGYRGGGEQ
ncbi:hypothetical protein ACFJIW_04930 [Tahibacter sp. UC22_41]|uniref:hypothetical protein n=1 Tax=Tahibacter sp. UC22_41 TaxID=3350178 RepID=UPI0036D75C6F